MKKTVFLFSVLALLSCRREEKPLPVPYLEPKKPEILLVYHQENNCEMPFQVEFGTEVANKIGTETYVWTYNGQSAFGEKYYASIGQTGNYSIRLVVSNSVGTDTFNYNFSYNSTSLPIIPAWSYKAENDNFRAPAKINFYNQSLRATSVLWDFGDGFLSNLPNTFHEYKNPGTYQVKLKAMCESDTQELVKQIVIGQEPDVLRFDYFELTAVPKNYFPENYDDNTRGGDFYFRLLSNGFEQGYSDLFSNRDKLPVIFKTPDDWNNDYRLWFSRNTNYNIELWDRNNNGDNGLINAEVDGEYLRNNYYPRIVNFQSNGTSINVYLGYED